MSSELFRQRERLAAAKLNRITAARQTATAVSNDLDLIGADPGTILIRDTDSWDALGPGTVGQVLTVGGDSLPGWDAPATSGTVTSVAVSGGATGLTTSGGPITTSGTITLAGTLAVASGGTGSSTAATARAALGVATGVVGLSWAGTVTAASQEVGRAPVRFDLTVPAGTYAFVASARVAATSSQTFTLYKDDGSSPASIGTAVFGAGSKTCTVTISADTSFTALTHAITAVGAVSPDATLADFTIPIPYTR